MASAPAACFDELGFAEIFFGMIDGSFDHGFHLFGGEAVGRLHVDGMLRAGAGVAGGDVEDSVGVDQEADFDSCHAGGHGGDAFEIEAGEAAVVLRHFALALQDVDENVGLAVDSGGEGFDGAGRDGRVAVNGIFDTMPP